jgi:hypothetical protein
MLSGRLQGFIPQTLAHFEEHILTLHTACMGVCEEGSRDFVSCMAYHDIVLLVLVLLVDL